MGLSYYWLQMIDVNSTNIEIIIPCMILGAGYGLVVGPITVLSASSFEGRIINCFSKCCIDVATSWNCISGRNICI